MLCGHVSVCILTSSHFMLPACYISFQLLYYLAVNLGERQWVDYQMVHGELGHLCSLSFLDPLVWIEMYQFSPITTALAIGLTPFLLLPFTDS